MAGAALSAVLFPTICLGFAPSTLPSARTRSLQWSPSPSTRVVSTSCSSALSAKKKGKSGGGSKGFAKASAQSAPSTAPPSGAGAPSYDDATNAMESTGDSFGLQSIDGPSTTDVTAPPPIELDPNLSPEERAEQILRQQYGLKTAAETEQDVAKATRELKLAGSIKKGKDKLEKYRQMSDAEFDIFAVIPAPLLKFIDVFLKGGLTVVTTAFIAAGMGITAEAWSKATGNDLPENIDAFIVNTVEPNFTTGLFVLLGFSVSLGLFASAQLGSGSSVYSEDP